MQWAAVVFCLCFGSFVLGEDLKPDQIQKLESVAQAFNLDGDVLLQGLRTTELRNVGIVIDDSKTGIFDGLSDFLAIVTLITCVVDPKGVLVSALNYQSIPQRDSRNGHIYILTVQDDAYADLSQANAASKINVAWEHIPQFKKCWWEHLSEDGCTLDVWSNTVKEKVKDVRPMVQAMVNVNRMLKPMPAQTNESMPSTYQLILLPSQEPFNKIHSYVEKFETVEMFLTKAKEILETEGAFLTLSHLGPSDWAKDLKANKGLRILNQESAMEVLQVLNIVAVGAEHRIGQVKKHESDAVTGGGLPWWFYLILGIVLVAAVAVIIVCHMFQERAAPTAKDIEDDRVRRMETGDTNGGVNPTHSKNVEDMQQDELWEKYAVGHKMSKQIEWAENYERQLSECSGTLLNLRDAKCEKRLSEFSDCTGTILIAKVKSS